jgi:hypothetical protein
VLYLAAAWACWRIARGERHRRLAPERLVWSAMAIRLVALGVNKQLDLQSALTELGRILGGWYDSRHRVQRVFILAVGSAAAVIGAFLLFVVRRAPVGTQVSPAGGCVLLAFVVIRASSFHHVDLFIRSRWWGIRGNWLMEVGSLVVILAGAGLRLRERGSPPPRSRPAGPPARAPDRGLLPVV